MMRIIVLLAAAALVLVAATLPEPEADPGPTFAGPDTPDAGAASRSSVWYCVWQDATDIRDANYNLASIPATEAVITLPSPLAGEEPDSETFALPSPGARSINVADLVRLGPAPGFIEYTDGPAGTSTIMTSDGILTGDRCVISVSKQWQLPGGTTRDGTQMTLRLFNPFPELAKVSVSGTSEFGVEPLPELDGLDVPGRSFRDFNLNEIVPFLDDLILTVSAEEGIVIPSVAVQQGGEDEASWPGVGLSATWYFPAAQFEDLVADVIIWNPGSRPVTVTIDAYTTAGLLPALRTVEVPPGVPIRTPIDDLADEGAVGLHLRGDGAVSAVVVATSPSDVLVVEEAPADDGDDGDAADDEPTQELVAQTVRSAGTIGSTELATGWLLPGAGATPDSTSTVWILNPNEESVTVTAQPLGVRPLQPAKLQVAAGSVLLLPLDDDPQIGGYLLESTLPIAAAWSADAPRGVAYLAGVPIAGG